MRPQTAVHWLIAKLVYAYDVKKALGIELDMDDINSYSEQAKEMEKEQIADAHIEGQRVFDKHPHTQWTNDQAEQYYNETYGN